MIKLILHSLLFVAYITVAEAQQKGALHGVQPFKEEYANKSLLLGKNGKSSQTITKQADRNKFDSITLNHFKEAKNKMQTLQNQNKQEEALVICREFKVMGCHDSSQLYYESLLDIYYYIGLNQYDNAIANCKTALRYAHDYKGLTQVGQVNNICAILLLNQRKTGEALPFLSEALWHAEDTQDKLQIAKSHDVQALYYLKMNDSQSQISSLLKAIDVALSASPGLEKDLLLSNIYSSISKVYTTLNYQDKSLHYGQLAYQLSKECHDMQALIRACYHLNYHKYLTHDQRIGLCKEGIQAANSSGWHEFTQSFHYLLAIYYNKLESCDSSKYYYLKANEMKYEVMGSGAKNDLNNTRFDAAVNLDPPAALLLLQDYEHNSTEEQKKNLSWRKRFEYRRAIYFAAIKQFDSAYATYTMYKNVSDSIQNKEFVESTEKLNIEFETFRKDNEIKNLKNENEIISLTVSNQEIMLTKQSLENLKHQQSLLIADLELKNKDKSLNLSQSEHQRKEQELLLVYKEIEAKQSQLSLLEQSKVNQELVTKQKLMEQEYLRIKERRNLTLGFMGGITGGLMLLIFGINRYRRLTQQKNYERIIQSLEEERNRISKDIHDDIGSTLSSVSIYNELIDKHSVSKPEIIPSLTASISIQTKDLMMRIEDIIWSLKTSKSQHETLEKRIKEYVHELLDPIQIKCNLLIEPKVEQLLQQPEHRRSILMIIKEAMNNSRKYSGANTFDVTLQANEEYMIIECVDNGQGFNIDKAQLGDGIKNIQERSKMMHGNASFNSIFGKGTSIVCHIPIAIFSSQTK